MAIIKDYSINIQIGLAAAQVVLSDDSIYLVHAFLGRSSATESEFQAALLAVESLPEGFLYFSDGQVRARDVQPSPGHKWDWPTLAWIRDDELARDANTAVTAAALQDIDDMAGRVRLRYITSIPGQSETYQRKEQQAREWSASGFLGAPPSFIAAEALALNVGAEALAAQVIDLADFWVNVKGPEIEACRRQWKVAVISAGADFAAIHEACEQGKAALDLL
jgi:hypothetical protein